ncbi:DNA mismatch endonuclease Vsr [Mesorhizobium australicum WSM2073]|uniref:Very short patch repair endonuclease n=1 Tax=Mesorhizobium australicum (strain HAMBI 3006 / LMG 24608 / WSM2073) TaxID=754035 RepID=L0KG88_MESAW|nr:DNA mismatch endonuclease Vsr [Mesorhizobium australicum]AGB43389.1 DNA mismatch endonuclease Vsr [Mesorhizobium australicum WSM2073]
MADFLSPAERSARMARIRSNDTSPEVTLRRALHRLGFRYVLRKKGLPGKPDLVFPKHRAVVFVHGCFWHRHDGCKVASTPKSNTQFWKDKFDRNVARDARVQDELRAQGWRVFVIWECDLQSRTRANSKAEMLAADIRREPDLE